ncbi:unnamed protein product [Blepharisma stoltei]|uniref:K Homology domain-containing protein n=1 Tax=Blepharisma stoltei TaxID=1481888 RepID=A0AAU9I9U7_9CILI|nr:unnamed protein product [Blepharisma stoltei]
MRSGSLDEMELKVLGMLFPELFRNRLESLKQEVIAQSGISEIRIDISKCFSDAIEVFITGGNNEIISACNIIFESFISDPFSRARMDILIPEQNAGKIIGFKGKNITKLCRNTRANINISKYSSTLRVGNIEGTLEMILKAVKQIFYSIYDIPDNSENLDESFHSTQSNPGAPKPPSQKNKKKNFEKRVERETVEEITKMITVPQNMVGWLLGRHMVGLQKLKELSECDITLLDSACVGINTEAEEMRFFQVKGLPKKVDIAIELIKAETNKFKLKEIQKESKSNSKNQMKNKEKDASGPEDEEKKNETENVTEKKWKKKNKNKYTKKEIKEEQKNIPLIEDFTKLNIPRNQKAVSLVIGQTGSGKSTFINYLTNFFRKGTLENKKIAIPTKTFPNQTERDFNHTERLLSSDHSQTNNCCAYNFKDLESSSTFTFIDTPGIGDTRGVDQDDENIQKIIKEVVNYPDINAIIIVQNGSEARNTASVKYTLNKLRNSLPSLVEKNVILVVQILMKGLYRLSQEKKLWWTITRLMSKISKILMNFNEAICNWAETVLWEKSKS